MIEYGYDVKNTDGKDLDLYPINYDTNKFDAVTAFEILEHLVSPFELLNSIKCKKIYASVPLRLWFSKSYRNNKDKNKKHDGLIGFFALISDLKK